LRVLYIEDNAMNRQVVGDMLQISGASMVGAPDAESGLRAVDEEAFDLVLMDIRMPGMDGLTAIGHLRQKDEPVSSVPVIVVTADTSADLRERCEIARADDVIMKPVSLQQLLSSIGRVMAQKSGTRMLID
jgi:two-component system response regulator QseB